VLEEVVRTCVERYHHSRGKFPARVVVFRNGTSEGQFHMVLTYEVPLIRYVLEDMKCDAKVTMIVPQKQHNVRLMRDEINPSDRPTRQNIEPGTVVDRLLVHPDYAEFYLNSHGTLQGTAKTPRYTVLYDESKFSMNHLQQMTYALAYGHQIVNLSISLPAPSYIAARYAERGRTLFNAYKIDSRYDDDEPCNTSLVTEKLSYKSTKFANQRINA
jgi:eukaryotic translation initiation factor 2C